MKDRRNHLRAHYPHGLKTKKAVTVYFEPDEYRALYDAAAQSGDSVAETLRVAVRKFVAP